MHICSLNHFQPHPATDIGGMVLLSDMGNRGFQKSNKLLEVTEQTQHLKPNLPDLKAVPISLPLKDLYVLAI